MGNRGHSSRVVPGRHSQKRLESTPHLTLIFGEGRFTGPHEVEVSSRARGLCRLAARKVVINTGCRPAVPALPGLERVPFLDSTSIMELEEVPRHLLVLGGGHVGLEFAQMFHRFASAVAVVSDSGQILGCTALGLEGGEIMSMVQIAWRVGGVPRRGP